MSVELKDIIKEENIVYKKTPVLTDNVMHYCPGCSHGVVHKIIAEVIEEMGIQDKTIGVSPVGCSVLAYNYLDIDWAEAAHGRAPAVATRYQPYSIPIVTCSPIKVMETCIYRMRGKSCTLVTVVKTSW